MSYTKLPSHSALTDKQFVQVVGPDDMLNGFMYDEQTRSLYARDSQVLASGNHGASHIADDPIPDATCDIHGLLASDDKCKLDALLQTRIGIAGFQGAGHVDDGGWMYGDIVIAAGSEFISIERFGNTIRFTCDSPLPLNCSCEECAQIFWIQDETDVSSIRPPSCAGTLPGVNSYGELKIYLMPESAVVNPSNPSATLNKKGDYPSLIFKRYDDSIIPGRGEFDLVLQRDGNNHTTTVVGWAMTPGPMNIPECVWYMGKDNAGNLIRFELDGNSEPGLLGHLLYKGHLLTKAMGIISNYTTQVLSTNQYMLKFWDVKNAVAIGDEFTAQNVWQYNEVGGTGTGAGTNALTLDRTIDLLDIGTLVDVWYFKISDSASGPILRYYFSNKPSLTADNIWNQIGSVAFGDRLTARQEIQPSVTFSTDVSSSEIVTDHRIFEESIWGLTGFDDPLMLFGDASASGPVEGIELNKQHRAKIDSSLPGLIVEASGDTDPFSERPVHLWNKVNADSTLSVIKIGRSDGIEFPPYDILLHAAIDSNKSVYMKVVDSGIFSGASGNWIAVKGVNFNDLPRFGSIRILNGTNANDIWNYSSKLVFPSTDDNSIILVGDVACAASNGDIVELLHQEYNCPVVRIHCQTNSTSSGSPIDFQIAVGTLDMNVAYGEDITDDVDDYIRGLAPGYAVSDIYTQADTFDGVGVQPESNIDNFVVYDGGFASDSNEYWNELKIMQRGSQVWIWWNNLLITPSADLSSKLPTSTIITTPYFPIGYSNSFGKFGMRLWPSAKVRSVRLFAQSSAYNEFKLGQLELT